MNRAARPRRRRAETGEAADVEALDFSDDRIPPRAGDPLDEEENDELALDRRARHAGMTGAGGSGEPTADDLSPETLLDDDGVDSPVYGDRGAADAELHTLIEVDELPEDDDEPFPPPDAERLP